MSAARRGGPIRHGERIATQQVDVLAAERGEPGHIFFAHQVALSAAVELGEDTPALLLVVQGGEDVQSLVETADLRDGLRELGRALVDLEGSA